VGRRRHINPHHNSLSFPAWYTSDRHSPVTTAGIGETDPGLSIPHMKKEYSPTIIIAHTPASIQKCLMRFRSVLWSSTGRRAVGSVSSCRTFVAAAHIEGPEGAARHDSTFREPALESSASLASSSSNSLCVRRRLSLRLSTLSESSVSSLHLGQIPSSSRDDRRLLHTMHSIAVPSILLPFSMMVLRTVSCLSGGLPRAP
jgi:hypothetical protein